MKGNVMVYIEGEEVFTSYVIVKGKKVFYFLAETGGLFNRHVWISSETMLSGTLTKLCTFKTEADAKACLAQLPQQKIYEGSYVKTFKMKIV